MPMKHNLYPPDWRDISLRVRNAADWKCRFCGAENRKPHPVTGSMVVLTVAHLDHDPANNQDANLAALCQRCHLRLDAEQHRKSASKTRNIRPGQIDMFDESTEVSEGRCGLKKALTHARHGGVGVEVDNENH